MCIRDSNKGYIIEATDVIYVSIRVLAGGSNQAGALVSKGSSALGRTFRAGMFTNENPKSNYLSFISVMATENNTLVNFDDLPTGILIKNYSGTLPISNIGKYIAMIKPPITTPSTAIIIGSKSAVKPSTASSTCCS